MRHSDAGDDQAELTIVGQAHRCERRGTCTDVKPRQQTEEQSELEDHEYTQQQGHGHHAQTGCTRQADTEKKTDQKDVLETHQVACQFGRTRMRRGQPVDAGPSTFISELPERLLEVLTDQEDPATVDEAAEGFERIRARFR